MVGQGSSKTRPLRYPGFPTFAAWEDSAPCLERWDRSIAELKELEASSDILRRARAIITGAAAALRDPRQAHGPGSAAISLFGALCQAAEPEPDGRLSLASQLRACAQMMSFAVNGRRLSEPWICKLQSLICDARGKQAARAGRYKRLPNRMVRQGGRALFGVPVSRAPQEMAKYVRELRSQQFLEAHPVLQASYSHYSLVLIHPFADGNGRVARLLAGAFLYRSTSIPVLSLSQDRGNYLSALRAADAGGFQRFINFVQDTSIASSTRVKSSILSAMEPSQVKSGGCAR
jgi:hypothetical protein